MLARIGVAGAVAANVMLASFALYSGQFGGMEGPYERFFRWVSLLLTTPALFGPGRVFFSGAWASLRTADVEHGSPDRDRAGNRMGARNGEHDHWRRVRSTSTDWRR